MNNDAAAFLDFATSEETPGLLLVAPTGLFGAVGGASADELRTTLTSACPSLFCITESDGNVFHLAAFGKVMMIALSSQNIQIMNSAVVFGKVDVDKKVLRETCHEGPKFVPHIKKECFSHAHLISWSANTRYVS